MAPPSGFWPSTVPCRFAGAIRSMASKTPPGRVGIAAGRAAERLSATNPISGRHRARRRSAAPGRTTAKFWKAPRPAPPETLEFGEDVASGLVIVLEFVGVDRPGCRPRAQAQAQTVVRRLLRTKSGCENTVLAEAAPESPPGAERSRTCRPPPCRAVKPHRWSRGRAAAACRSAVLLHPSATMQVMLSPGLFRLIQIRLFLPVLSTSRCGAA